MKTRTLLLWLIPAICTILAAMQLSRHLNLTSLTSLRQTSLRASIPSLWRPYTSPSSLSSVNQEDDDSQSQSSDPQEQQKDPLGLPQPPSQDSQTLDLNSEQGLRFDSLGPIVVNKDGTMSRITNWDKMAPIEKENTLKILGKRNKARLAALREDGGGLKG